MYSSGGSPIYVPSLWPFSYYNTRYGIALVAFAAFAVGGVVTRLPERWRHAAFALPVLALLPWLWKPQMDKIVCWKESEVNSRARRAWTGPAAEYLAVDYKKGQGITAQFGDLTGIFCRAGIPLKEVLHEGNGPEWLATKARPDLLDRNLWLVSLKENDELAQEYRLMRIFSGPEAAAARVYRRAH
jgi:hypothetical protein